MIHAWNNKTDEAARVNNYYLIPQCMGFPGKPTGVYLEILTTKRQGDHLNYLFFEDRDFRKRFLARYQAYIPLLVSGRYELTRMHDAVGAINRVNNANKAYLLKKNAKDTVIQHFGILVRRERDSNLPS